MPYSLLSAPVREAVRTLPAQQCEEILRYDDLLAIATNGLQVASRKYSRRCLDDLYTRVVSPLVTRLAMQDLRVAQRHEYPALTPDRGMYIAERSIEVAEGFAREWYPRAQTGNLSLAATGIVGLHASILGRMDVLEEPESVKELQRTVTGYKTHFIRELPRSIAYPPR